MKATGFKESNHTLKCPKSMPNCEDLDVLTDGQTITSCWLPDLSEVMDIVAYGNVWLQVYGQGHPPVSLLAGNVFDTDNYDNNGKRVMNRESYLAFQNGLEELKVKAKQLYITANSVAAQGSSIQLKDGLIDKVKKTAIQGGSIVHCGMVDCSLIHDEDIVAVDGSPVYVSYKDDSVCKGVLSNSLVVDVVRRRYTRTEETLPSQFSLLDWTTIDPMNTEEEHIYVMDIDWEVNDKLILCSESYKSVHESDIRGGGGKVMIDLNAMTFFHPSIHKSQKLMDLKLSIENGKAVD